MAWSKTVGPMGLAFLLLAVVAAGPASAVAPNGTSSAHVRPDVRSQAFYIFDWSNSAVLAARNEHSPLPIASISKLMTALVVLEAKQPMDQMLTITADDVRGTAGEHSRLAQGTRLSRGDLLRLALMSSENRAAHALCRSYPEGKPACVKAMNKKATALGMKSAHFVEPTGLSSRNVASPEDLAHLVLAAAGNYTIRTYSTTPRHTVRVGRQALEYRNTNLLVDKPDWHVNVQKTGYIPKAGRCLVMQADIDGRSVVIVLLNSYGKLTRIADARRIRSWVESQRRLAAI